MALPERSLHLDSVRALEDIRSKNDASRIVFVSGNFNIVHPGHLRLLRFAAECGDYLVVGVLSDQVGSAIVPEELRLEALSAISHVNYCFILRDPPGDFVGKLRPEYVVKGKEHEDKENVEFEIVQSYGGKLLFGSGDATFSSIDLLRQAYRHIDLSTIVLPNDYPRRHDFSMDDLRGAIANFSDLRVLVLGDTIIDEYVTCDALGMSQEDPTLVVMPILTNRFIGGAAIVAAHAAGLGAKVQYFSVVGDDAVGNYARENLETLGISANLIEDASRPTTLKQRFRAQEKTLLRVSYLRQQEISKEHQAMIVEPFREALEKADLVIFSDFNYGFLPNGLVEKLSELAHRRGVLMVADSQSSSQIGDVSRYPHMALLTATEREARLAVRDFTSGLVVLAEELRLKADAQNVFIKLGGEGVLIHAPKAGNWITDRLPAFNNAPKDIAGAGDSFLTCSAMALARGVDVWQSAYLGSLAAACQVGRVGNIPLRADDLLAEIE